MPKVNRRQLMGLSLAGLAGASAAGCSTDTTGYAAIIAETTGPLAATPDVAELVRYATLAANSHNTQPWRFQRAGDRIRILPDTLRGTPVVDPDGHHLFASLGGAAENLSIAARARGMQGDIVYTAADGGHASVGIAPGRREESPLFAAIPVRQCTRSDYDGRVPPADVMARLAQAVRIDGVDALFLTDRKSIEDVLALLVVANGRQVEDEAFVAELKSWLRFDTGEYVATRDGLYSATTGNPTLPRWLGATMFDWFFTKDAENDKLARQVRSSAGLLVLVADRNDSGGWLAAGRACQRFALQATADGLKHAFVNQAVEVPEVRGELQSLLGLADRRPDLIVRFGYGETMPRSLRRSVRDVIV